MNGSISSPKDMTLFYVDKSHKKADYITFKLDKPTSHNEINRYLKETDIPSASKMVVILVTFEKNSNNIKNIVFKLDYLDENNRLIASEDITEVFISYSEYKIIEQTAIYSKNLAVACK